MEWQGNRWHLNKHPFQELYRQATEAVQADYFSVPWQIKKNRRRHLVFVYDEGWVIPDQAMFNFTLLFTDMDTGQPFEITRPGTHRLTWPVTD